MFLITNSTIWPKPKTKKLDKVTPVMTDPPPFNGIVHYFTMSILKEQAAYGHHDGVILAFSTCKHKEKWTN